MIWSTTTKGNKFLVHVIYAREDDAKPYQKLQIHLKTPFGFLFLDQLHDSTHEQCYVAADCRIKFFKAIGCNEWDHFKWRNYTIS